MADHAEEILQLRRERDEAIRRHSDLAQEVVIPLQSALSQTTADMERIIVALGFGRDERAPMMAEVMRKIEVLQEAKTVGAQWCEALNSCAEILGVPFGSSISTGVTHAVAELREQSEHRAEIILKLQAKL